MKNKKLAGIICIAIALLLINIIPDPTDVVTLQVYSVFTGADVSPSNLSSVYLDFLWWSFLVGLIFLFSGMYLLDYDVKKLWKKLDIDKYKLSILFAFISVLLVSLLNLKSFWLMFLIVPVGYWFYIRKDKSECLGLLGASWILFLGGVSTLSSFIFKRVPIPEILSQSDSTVFLSWLATTLGFTQVSNIILFIGVFISILVTILFTKALKEYF